MKNGKKEKKKKAPERQRQQASDERERERENPCFILKVKNRDVVGEVCRVGRTFFLIADVICEV